MTLVPVKEYASAEEMMAAYAERHRPAMPVVVIAPPVPKPPVLSGKKRTGNLWNSSEIDTLLDMAAAKFSARAIATKLRRSTGAVQGKARSIGVILHKRPSREFQNPARAEEITKLYRLVFESGPQAHGRVSMIIQICAEKNFITVADILSDSRSEPIILARQQAMWLAAKETRLSLPALGKLFGRDHTTVLHGIRRENSRTGQNVRGVGGRRA